MISNAYRASWKIALVFVLVFATLSTGSNTTRSAHAAAIEPYIGEIQLFPYNYAPSGWVFAAGQTLTISQNQALFALLGTQYGGDGRTTFALPNLTSLSIPDGMGYYIALNGIYPSRGDGVASIDNSIDALAGEVRLFPYGYAPNGWARLDGSSLSKSQFPLLYSILGSQSDSGDGSTFTLPNISNPLPGQRPFFAIALSSSNSNQQGRNIEDGTGNEFLGETIPFVVPMQTTASATDGRTLPIASNQALFALIGNTFGGDGMRNFNLPNLTSNPYSFYYYTFMHGVFPSRDSSGAVPSSLAGTSEIATVGSGGTKDYSKADLLSSSNGTGVSIRTQPQHGTVVDTGGGLTYTAQADYVGADHFTIRTYNATGFAQGYSTISIHVESPKPPVITGVSDGGVYNQPVTPVISSGLATLNGQPFTSGTPITADGSYTLLATNTYGSQQITFTLDSTPPVVSGVTNGGRYTVPPTISFNEGTAKLNGMAFTSGGSISQEGNYTLIVTDTANNSSTITFSYYAPRLLSFNSNGGTSVATQNLYYGDVSVEPAKPTRTGYTFTGWYRDAELTQPFDFANTAVTASTQLYAGWSMNQYVISFNTDGGTAIAPVTVNYGSLVSPPTPPTLTGYSFNGWYSDAAHTQLFDFTNRVITADLQLYAGWNINQYTVSFDSGGGTAVADRAISYNTLLSEPPAPTRTGYTFNGWYRDAAHTQQFDFTATPVTANIQLYAGWVLQSYTVTFNVYSGANMPNQTIPYGTLITRPADPVQAGHTFTGWYTDAVHTQPFDFQTVIMTPITVYAGWSVNQYTAVFNSNGGTAVSDQRLDYGSPLFDPQQPTRTGYTFTGWYGDAGLQQRFDFASSVIRSDIQLYAGWERNQYTVSFDTYGGSVVRDVYIGYGDLLTIPNAPTADDAGSIFAGWFADSRHNLPFDFSQPIVSNVILYAKWAVRVQQITFDTDGGTTIAGQKVAYGDRLSRPADPQRAGYTFAGWYTDAAHTQSFDFATDRVTADLTLYAKWTITVHTVTFDVDGGTTVPNQTVNEGATLSRPTDPTRSGYTFNGWYSDSARSQRFDFAKVTVTSDVTLYAGWNQISESSSGNGRSGGSTSSNTNINTTQAQVTIPAGQAGELRIGSGVWLQVPAGAADQALEIKASMMTTPPTGLGSDQRVVSPVYEFLKNTQGTFKIPVKLTLSFDPSTLRSDEKLAVFYQTEADTPWTMVEGSTVSGNTISASVNHFTRFTVMAVPVTTTTPTTPSTGGDSDTTPTPVSTTFSDISNHWAAESIREAAALGIVKGYADGTFHPGGQVTRAEFTVMLIRMLKPATSAGSTDLPAFTDSSQIGAWARDDIATASALGWVKGNADGGFRPNASITRAEMAVMVSRALGLTGTTAHVTFADAATIPTWANEAAAYMQQAGWMNGRTNGDFDPSAVTTRAEAAQVLMRAHQ
ncbi:InlB B-repeat-containing protein [Paenibacillus kandeliae]|uniref:InlB B-repeat-containing protein n=1 Tax=Paenibacillus kandeliae TaxID=3231269 RepID=UPI00345AE2B5